MDIIDICICEELWSRWVSWEQGQLILGDRVVCNSIDRHLISSIYLIACPLYRYPVDPAFRAIPDRTGSIRGSDWSAGNHADTIFLLPTHHDATHGRDCPLCHSDMVVQLTGVSLVLQQWKAQGKPVDKWMKQSNRQTNKQTNKPFGCTLLERKADYISPNQCIFDSVHFEFKNGTVFGQLHFPWDAQVMKPNLSWSYRIQGVAEAPADPTLHTFGVPLATDIYRYIMRHPCVWTMRKKHQWRST